MRRAEMTKCDNYYETEGVVRSNINICFGSPFQLQRISNHKRGVRLDPKQKQ